MKWCLSLLVAFFLLAPQAGLGREENAHDYLAVFCNPGWEHEWDKYKPDLVFTASDWDDFNTFLRVVRKQAGSHPIVLSVDTHGEDSGFYLQYQDPNKPNIDSHTDLITHQASMGYIVNEVNRYLNPRKVTMITEACYSGRALHNTLRGYPRSYHDDGDDLENTLYSLTFPIYGVGASTVNFGNTVFLQYYYNFRTPFFQDIRQYERGELPLKVNEARGNPHSVFAIYIYNMYMYLSALDIK